MNTRQSGLRAGAYVDFEYMDRNGGRVMQFGALRTFLCRRGAEPMRLNAYAAYDRERARRDRAYRERKDASHNAIRDAGFKVIEKPVRWYTDEDGQRVSKANSDLDLATDMLLQSDRLDDVTLLSGDGDFVPPVRAVQSKGCRVEVVAFDNVSQELRRECDLFVSGYLIPSLLPNKGTRPWGEPGSVVRGTCCSFFPEKGYGFLRYYLDVSCQEQAEVFFHRNDCPEGLDIDELPSRDIVLEFTLAEDKGDKFAARRLQVVVDYAANGGSSGNGNHRQR